MKNFILYGSSLLLSIYSTSASAGPSATVILNGYAEYLAGACNNSSCPSVKITVDVLYQDGKARYCAFEYGPHEVSIKGAGLPGAISPPPDTFVGHTVQYRSELLWTTSQAATAAGVSTPPGLAPGYPFSPFNAPGCGVTIKPQPGTLLFSSVASGAGEITFDLQAIDGMLVGVQTVTSNGRGIASVVIEKSTQAVSRLR